MLSIRSNNKWQSRICIISLISGMISIQSGASLAKKLFPSIGTFGVTALRLFIASIILCTFFKPWKKRFKKESFIHLIIYGISLGSMNSLFYLSLDRIPLGIAVALEFTGPLSVAFYLSKKIIDFFWIIMVMIGLLLLFPFYNNSELDPIGIIYALLAGICWSAYIVSGKIAGTKYGSSITVSLGSLISTLIFFPLGIIKVGAHELFNFSILPTACAVSFLSTTFPYTIEMFALTRMSTRTFGTLMSLEPAIGALIGKIFLHENLSCVQWVALLFIIFASIGSTLVGTKR
ncbi:threonine/homoserine exporter RhtA [Candidatus Riesia pediculischaeffi]|uniref:Threonine/homoserine exporter RhtA n=2 Tax=Candidatus Riesia pediculischaeffi TaxID=428411 RepID=A0A1V0HJX7_9ENTR|nr:threonine/homoserine exporter RhtA [Candidatus Riesia pediculischaeffi]ARC53119.1 threonine transporter RhtB [Candidatus Riesia pediculischaeffi]KIE64263.1 Integral membrane protein [Candidatus Riesia pediculischaeffi PTSU]